MSRLDPTTEQAVAALSWAPPTNDWSLDRRRFLQAAAAGVTVAAMPGWMQDIAGAATPIGPGQGVLVVVTMDGGNDPLDTVVPISDGRYYDARGSIAIRSEQALHITGQRGFHPALGHLRARWDLGHVAVIDGVGNPKVDLSHFSAMADVMHGKPASGVPRTGWLGRYLDGLGGDPLHGISIGNRVPLVITGATTSGTALPATRHFVKERSAHGASMYASLESMGAGTTGLGPLADALADTGAGMMAMSDQIRPLYEADGDTSKLATHLRLAAGLLNADLGVRVIHVRHGGYDSHSGQVAQHGARMRELDEGLRVFHETLASGFAARTMVLCVSEFGRRVRANGSAGTDHGAGYTAMAIGPAVNGGLHGSLPSLGSLTRQGNLTHSIDYRSLFATVLDRWLDADARAILGVDATDLGFLGTPGQATGGVTTASFRAEHGDVLRLYRAFFDREPDSSGARYWTGVYDRGNSLDVIAESFTESPEFRNAYQGTTNEQYVRRVYENVLGRTADSAGYDYWLGELRRGALSRGTLVRWVAANDEFARRHPYTRLP